MSFREALPLCHCEEAHLSVIARHGVPKQSQGRGIGKICELASLRSQYRGLHLFPFTSFPLGLRPQGRRQGHGLASPFRITDNRGALEEKAWVGGHSVHTPDLTPSGLYNKLSSRVLNTMLKSKKRKPLSKRGTTIALVAIAVLVLLAVVLISQWPTDKPTLVRRDITDIVGPWGVILEDTEFTSPDGLALLEIAEGTIPQKEDGGALEYIEIEVVCGGTPPPPLGGYMIGCAYYFRPAGTTFDQPVTMTIDYTPALLGGRFVEENLVIAYSDIETGEWVVLDSVSDSVNRTVRAQVSSFGMFAVFALPIPEYYKFGQWAETSRQLLTVTSATRSSSYTYRAPYVRQAPPGMVFVIIVPAVVNMKNTPLAISPGDFIITDSKGHQYRNGVHESADPYRDMKLAPGLTATGPILFVVPKVATGLEASSVLHTTPLVRAIWKVGS